MGVVLAIVVASVALLNQLEKKQDAGATDITQHARAAPVPSQSPPAQPSAVPASAPTQNELDAAEVARRRAQETEAERERERIRINRLRSLWASAVNLNRNYPEYDRLIADVALLKKQGVYALFGDDSIAREKAKREVYKAEFRGRPYVVEESVTAGVRFITRAAHFNFLGVDWLPDPSGRETGTTIIRGGIHYTITMETSFGMVVEFLEPGTLEEAERCREHTTAGLGLRVLFHVAGTRLQRARGGGIEFVVIASLEAGEWVE